MARLACALLLLAVASCSASESRIVGGAPTSIENFPYLLQLQTQLLPRVWTQTCGGLVLTSRFVLTGARCVRGGYVLPRRFRVRAGTSYRNTGGSISTVDSVTNHPSFRENIGYDGDISVLRLATPLTYSVQVQQATILAQGAAVPDNIPVVQAGWGVSVEEIPDVRATQLQEVTVFTVNNAVCAETYANTIIPRTVTQNMICAARPGGGAGACVGDTGGPLLFNNIAVGLVSWGWSCTNATFPRVHTAISSYTDWIIQTAV